MIAVEKLFISKGHNFVGHHGRAPDVHPTLEVDEIECIAGRGIRGDRFFDHQPDFRGQITFFSAEVFSDLCAALGNPHLTPSALRRNALVRGIDLNALIGTTFTIGGVVFAGIEECRPCYWMNTALGAGAETWLRGRGGLRCRILSDGILARASSTS